MAESIGARPRKRFLPWVAGALALLVVAGVGVTVGIAVVGQPFAPVRATVSPSDPDEQQASPEEQASPEPTPTEPTSAGPTESLEFSSPSGNIRCHIDSETAYCHQGAFLYGEPPENCAADGVAVGVNAEGAYWPCLSARPAQGPAVAYDVPVRNGALRCVISYTTGATCTHASGSGFTMEYTAGVVTF